MNEHITPDLPSGPWEEHGLHIDDATGAPIAKVIEGPYDTEAFLAHIAASWSLAARLAAAELERDAFAARAARWKRAAKAIRYDLNERLYREQGKAAYHEDGLRRQYHALQAERDTLRASTLAEVYVAWKHLTPAFEDLMAEGRAAQAAVAGPESALTGIGGAETALDMAGEDEGQ